jgi:DNA-binding transcriptional regulator YhcF (GntR family)
MPSTSRRPCPMCYSTRMIPFHVEIRPGGPIYEQIVYAATKAVISGQLRPGDPFPSVRSLSKELKINPNTTHKVITHLVTAGMLEIRPGFGTVVAKRPQATKAEKTKLLGEQFEALIVEGKRLGIDLADMQDSLENHWKRLNPRRPSRPEPAQGGRER